MDPTKLARQDFPSFALFLRTSNYRRPDFLRMFLAATSALLFFLSTSQISTAQGTASVQFQVAVPLTPATGPSSNPNGPFGVAVDKAGDLFISDFNNNRVLDIPAGCTSTACQVTLPTSGLSGPTGLAVDGNGNVFIADYHNNRVVEVPWTGSGFGTQITVPSTGQNFPSGVAVDSAGDLFIANDDYTSATASQVVELPWTGSGFGTPTTVVNWLSGPFGLAIDGTGNMFVADYVANQAVEVPKGCSSSSCQIIIPDSGSLGPTAISVDQAGDVFITYFGGNEVIEMPAGCSGSACEMVVGNGLGQPAGVAIGTDGAIFVADSGYNRLLKVTQNSFNLGTVALGSTGSVAAYFTFNSTTTLNTTTPYSLLTRGVTGLDFADAGGSTCTATTYNSGETCSVQFNFTPQSAGSVNGALMLSDTSGNTVATGYLSGIGWGPQLTFLPGKRSSVGVNLASSPGVGVDGKGNLFVADSANRTVEELLAPTYTTSVALGGSFSFTNPVGLAVDGAGNVFVADTGAASIEEIPAPDYGTVNLVGSGLSSPSGVAVDGSGNLYVADTGHNSVKEILEGGGYTTIDTLASSFSAPRGVAVDGAGNVYVADTGNSAAKEIEAVNGSIPASPTITTLGSGFSAPAGIAVDGVGNVYVADTGNDAVEKLTAASGFAAKSTLDSGFGGPSGVTVDSNGNVYVGSSASTQVVKLDYADPPTLNFVAGAGETSSPQTATITNYGNADFTFAPPATGYNPSVSSDFTIETNQSAGSPCPLLTATSGAATLAAGSSCTDQLTFSSPSGGSVSGSMVITDDNLNVPGSTQTIVLNGTSVVMTLTPTSLTSAQVGTAYSQTITAGGGAAPYGYQVTGGSLPAGITLDNSGVLSGTPTAAGSFSFTLTAKDANGITGSQAYSLTVSAPTISMTPATLPDAQINVAYSQALTASGGTAPYSFAVTGGSLPAGLALSSDGVISGTPTASGPSTFSVTATDSSTGTGAPFSVVGAYSLTVNGSNLTIAPATLPSGQVSVAYPLVSLTASGGTAPYSYKISAGSLPAGLTLNSAGMLSGTPTAGGSFNFTVTATDANSSTGSQTYAVTVSAPVITISPGALPAAKVNVAYGLSLTGSGGTAPYTFSLTGTLPAGIAFDNSTGAFSGTPTAGGSFPITVTATDSSTGTGPYSASVNLNLTVNAGTAVLTFAAVSQQTYGNPPFTVSASSASSGAITYSIASGPATINSSTGLVTLTGAGEVVLEASQAATADYNSTVAEMPMNVAKQSSTTSVSASSSSAGAGQNVTLTATVSPSVTGSPTGTVSFFDGGTAVGSAVPLTNGSAQLTTASLPSGSNVISAVYSGDGNFLGSNATLSSPIVISGADFTFAATGTTAQSIMPGGTATFSFALAPTYTNYPGTVTFSVEGLPAGATDSLSAKSVSRTAGSQTITLTIRSASGTASISPPGSGRRYAPFALALLLPFLGLGKLRSRRRKVLGAIRLLVLVTAGMLTISSLSGCGGAVSGSLGSSYSVAVTATSGNLQHTAFVSVTVK